MATASDAARARDEAESRAEALYRAAVAYVALQAATNDQADEDDDDSLVLRAAVALALALIVSLPKRTSTDLTLSTVVPDRDEVARKIGEQIGEQAVRDAAQHFRTVTERVVAKGGTRDDAIREFRDDTPWVSAAARSMTTRAAAETAIELRAAVDEATGEKHDLLWISRGDHKVRSSHRRLHGIVKAVGKPFKRFPDGRTLKYPGDPTAPMDEWINCRCALLLVPARMASKAMDVMRVEADEWRALDSLAASVGAGGVDTAAAVADLMVETARSAGARPLRIRL